MISRVADPSGAAGVSRRLSRYGCVVSASNVAMVRYKVEEGIPSTVEVPERGTPVYARDGLIGTVERILAERKSGQINHLVVQRRAAGECTIIPAAMIEGLQEVGIRVDASLQDVAALPACEVLALQDAVSDLANALAPQGSRVVLDRRRSG